MQATRGSKVPVLTYHSIDESGSVISTSPDVFRRQMRSLKDSGHAAISIAELASVLADGGDVPPKTVSLTFDDGFQNFYTSAYPVLCEYGFSATVFLVSDRCGKFNDWEDNHGALPVSRLLSWKEVGEIAENGIEIGSHSRTHQDLSGMSAADAMREIVDSKTEIENRIGRPVRTFAYPYGRYNAGVRKSAEEHYAAACSTNLGKVHLGSDIHSLERIDAFYLSKQIVFESLESALFDQYLQIRQAMRKFQSVFYRG